MRAYRVTATDTGTTLVATRYAATQADARAKRDELMAAFSLKKQGVVIEELDIPTAKADLLEFINELAAQADAVEE